MDRRTYHDVASSGVTAAYQRGNRDNSVSRGIRAPLRRSYQSCHHANLWMATTMIKDRGPLCLKERAGNLGVAM
jgi:cation transport regulator ChaB